MNYSIISISPENPAINSNVPDKDGFNSTSLDRIDEIDTCPDNGGILAAPIEISNGGAMTALPFGIILIRPGIMEIEPYLPSEHY